MQQSNEHEIRMPRADVRFVRVILMCLIIACFCLETSTFGQTNKGSFRRLRPVRGVNSGFRDANPFLSPDELTIYFSSSRPSVLPWDDDIESWDIWTANRNSVDDPFDNVRKLSESISVPDVGELNPRLTADGLTLYYASAPDELTGELMYVTRETIESEWGTPQPFAGAVNDLGINVSHPHLSNDGLTIYFNAAEEFEPWDLFKASRSSIDAPFENVAPLEGINSGDFHESMSTLSADQRTIIYATPLDGQNFEELWIATRASTEEQFDDPQNINDFAARSSLNQGSTAEITPWLSQDWPAPGSKLYFSRAFTGDRWEIWSMTWDIPNFVDVTLDDVFDAADMDALSEAVRTGGPGSGRFDLNEDQMLNDLDRQTWLERMQRFAGDSNLDGEFNSADLVVVFSAGEYEDEIPFNSGWADGDWNGDGDFNSSDLVTGFQVGRYEQGPLVPAVPEPTSTGGFAACFLLTPWMRFRLLNRS